MLVHAGMLPGRFVTHRDQGLSLWSVCVTATEKILLVYDRGMTKEPGMNKRDSRFRILLVKQVQKAERQLAKFSNEIGALRDEIEFPLMIEDIKATRKNLSLISASWLQRRYGIGYACAARLLDEIRKS
jgi:DNA segregation ATPase FtsK/SpoIIIE-like protein